MKAKGFSVRGLLAGALLALSGVTLAAGPVTVYKSPTCGCCNDWVRYLQRNGFEVKIQDVPPAELTRLKQRLGVPEQFSSCHTALVEGYVVEGHVPATAIRKLLAERPGMVGVAVPSMPVGSPGMEGPNPQPFSAIAFDDKGRAHVVEKYQPPYRW